MNPLPIPPTASTDLPPDYGPRRHGRPAMLSPRNLGPGGVCGYALRRGRMVALVPKRGAA